MMDDESTVVCGTKSLGGLYAGPSDLVYTQVGGTDGSGTRGVVDVLQSLGVAMVMDDHVQKDAHGVEMEDGWPPIVSKVRWGGDDEGSWWTT
jgi:hypothetical protein